MKWRTIDRETSQQSFEEFCSTRQVVCDEEYKDLRIVYNEINYDDEAKAIVKHFIDNGFYQANISY